ncbi:MAG: DNA polymerase III subunit gamma/tau, partial [Betaproteobacteria bacterium]|nr:DNA polymerase III subunit gamma/tau [Betaproteobacteria bacterium]
MTYQVLARKWRPRDFAGLVGQEHVVRALRNALEQRRLHHAYLFTGTRGVGKTTLARILAKCLNCETGITAAPCGRCTPCLEIDGGRFVDYVEMDAASNRGVDEMTQLLERAVYAPTSGRFKVYVIDEVHQLSGHAFNAMLKTLEEPPEHLKFILATTDPQKVPVTVLSRCLQFNLKQMPRDQIAGHLARILEAEGLPFEAHALPPIARAAAGSMRDALSLLDQAIAYGAGRIDAKNVRAMLGAIDASVPLRLLEAVVREDAREVLAIGDELQARTLSFDAALQDLAALLLRISIAHSVPDAVESDLPDRDRVVALATRIDAESAQLFYQIALQGRDDLPLAPDEHAGFTMTLLRMLAFRPEDSVSAPAVTPDTRAREQATAPATGGPGFDGDWPSLVRQLAVTGAAKELARNSELLRYEDGFFGLVVPQTMPHLAERSYQEKLKAALEQHLGRQVRVHVARGEIRGTSA